MSEHYEYSLGSDNCNHILKRKYISTKICVCVRVLCVSRFTANNAGVRTYRARVLGMQSVLKEKPWSVTLLIQYTECVCCQQCLFEQMIISTKNKKIIRRSEIISGKAAN